MRRRGDVAAGPPACAPTPAAAVAAVALATVGDDGGGLEVGRQPELGGERRGGIHARARAARPDRAAARGGSGSERS